MLLHATQTVLSTTFCTDQVCHFLFPKTQIYIKNDRRPSQGGLKTYIIEHIQKERLGNWAEHDHRWVEEQHDQSCQLSLHVTPLMLWIHHLPSPDLHEMGMWSSQTAMQWAHTLWALLYKRIGGIGGYPKETGGYPKELNLLSKCNQLWENTCSMPCQQVLPCSSVSVKHKISATSPPMYATFA